MLKKSLSALSLTILLALCTNNRSFASEGVELEANRFTHSFNIGKSPNHPERKWKVLETEHFLIHFYQGFEEVAKTASNIGEEAYYKVTKDLKGNPSSKIPILLTQDEFLNGYAEPIKNRIVLDPILMRSSVIGARRFITHEFTHIITYEALSTGPSITKLYGLNNTPTWFLEGLAQYEAEYWYPSYDRMLRLNTLERTILSPTERDAFSILGADEGAAGYNEGYSITKYIFETYGHDKLAKVLEEIKSSNVPLAIALERVVGKSLLVLEADWRQSLEENYRKQIEGKDQTVKNYETVVDKEKNDANIRPKVSPDGKIFTYMTSQGRGGYVNIRGKLIGLMPIRARLLNQSKKSDQKVAGERVNNGVFTEKDSKSALLAGGVLDYAWAYDNSTIALTQVAGDSLGNPDTQLGFTSMKIVKNKIESKDIYSYDYQIFDVNDKENKTPLKSFASPTFSPLNKKTLAFVATTNEIANIYQINLKDLDKKETKVKAIPITNTKGYLYRDLSWSPDGKYIVANMYKPGDGGNLALIDINNGETKLLTKDSVLYTNSDPSWTDDSKKIYFSSDKDNISNLYSFDLTNNKTEKLSNSYAGLEFPFFRDNLLYFTSYFAKGTDIKRIDINNLQKFPTKQVEPELIKDIPVIAENKNYKTSDYIPWLSPDLIIPITGVDERGDQIGLRASFDDILQKHAVNATVVYGLLSSRISYGISYVNYMLDPLLAVQFSEFPSIAATQDGKTYYYQRVRGLNFVASRPLFNELSQQISNVGSIALSFNNLDPIQESIATGTDKNLIRSGLNNFVSFNFSSQDVSGGSTADIHPTNGYRFDFKVEHANKLLQSKYEYTQVLTDIRKYVPLWYNHALALRGAFEFSTGNTTPLLLGGPPVNLSIGIQDFIPLRGFNIAQFIGNRLALVSTEYRFPIFTRINTVLNGLYLDSVYGAVFLDAGDAWFAEQRNPQLNLGGGGELRFRVAVGGRGTLGAYVGLARKLTYVSTEPVNNQFYFGFANSF